MMGFDGADKTKSMCNGNYQYEHRAHSTQINKYQEKEENKTHLKTHTHRLLFCTHTDTQYFPFEPKHFCSWPNKSILHISYGDFNDILSFLFCFHKLAGIFVCKGDCNLCRFEKLVENEFFFVEKIYLLF